MNLTNFEFKLYLDDAPILHRKSEPVVPDSFFEDHKDFIEDMFEFMAASGGVGLAAPQIGLGYRFFIIKDGPFRRVCVNPEIIESSDTEGPYKEGCLSYPELRLTIRRPMSVKVRYWDDEGSIVEETLYGLHARVFQHEFDHINGVVFSDLVGETKLKAAQRKVVKALKKLKPR